MLKINNLHAFYGPIEALRGINLEAKGGKITCLIGSNGAGKSTLLNSICGMIESRGSITFNGLEILGQSPQSIARLGIAHVPEGRHVFPGLTVEENLETGTITWHGYFARKSIKSELNEVYGLFPRLFERRKQLAWSLSGGEQQMLAIGRALMSRPKFLLLDEPSMGLAPVLVTELFQKIVAINKLGLSVLINEQNARLAMKISDYTYVIEHGMISLCGESSVIINDSRIIEAYLGHHEKDA